MAEVRWTAPFEEWVRLHGSRMRVKPMKVAPPASQSVDDHHARGRRGHSGSATPLCRAYARPPSRPILAACVADATSVEVAAMTATSTMAAF